MRRYVGLVLLGVSLSVKHDLVFLPLWLAMLPRKTMDGAARRDDVRASVIRGDRLIKRRVDSHQPPAGAGPATVPPIWRWRLACLTIPYSVFGLTFLPFLAVGDGPAIWRKVVQFHGFNNAPFWNMIGVGHVLNVAPPFALFIGAMLAAGFVVTRRTQ